MDLLNSKQVGIIRFCSTILRLHADLYTKNKAPPLPTLIVVMFSIPGVHSNPTLVIVVGTHVFSLKSIYVEFHGV